MRLPGGDMPMRDRIVIATTLILATFIFGQSARAAPATYDYVGWVTHVKVLDPSIPLPENFGPGARQFLGTLAVDLALPPQQRLLHLSAFDTPLVDNRGTIEAATGHPDNRVISQRTSELGIGVPPPHWEVVTVSANTGPLPNDNERSIGM